MDAPEPDKPMGPESRDLARKLMLGSDVHLTCGGKSYKRAVCRVVITSVYGSLDFGAEMVAWGLVYDSARYSSGWYRGAQQFAEKMSRGVWTLPDGGTRPWEWRKMQRVGR